MVRDEVIAYIGVGANLGDARRAVNTAIDKVARLPLTRQVVASSLYRSAPVDADGPDFINAVMAIQTGLTAYQLLCHLQQLELASGRERPYRNAPRTLDLDVLLFDSAQIYSPTLQVPHPRMYERAFVLLPLSEIAPDRVTAAQLEFVADQQITRFYAT